MPASIGVNLRVTGHCRQGGRKYMEDFFSVAYQQTEDEKDLEYAFFGIYDGHGGAEAAAFAKEHLMETIIKHKSFWSDCDDDVLRAIKDGYIATHYAMWREQEKWPRTASGLPSTAGTTASVAFIRRGKIYIGHVGDSGIILGYQEPGSSEWKARPLTRDHKPENVEEMSRIEQCGGKVVSKSGVPRVVWNRPKIGHQGPVRRSTPIDEIPFLAVARSLGDLWSYNSQIDRFIVSPDPDCLVLKIDTDLHRCLIFGTDGLYNMLSPAMAVHIVQQAERHNETAALSDSTYKTWLNPSKLLVERALERWHATKMRADNTSVVTLMLDPPGPPRAQVLKDRKKNLPERGLKIMTRFDGNLSQDQTNPSDTSNTTASVASPNSGETAKVSVDSPTEMVQDAVVDRPELPATDLTGFEPSTKEDCMVQPVETLTVGESASISSSDLINALNNNNQPNYFPLKEHNFLPKPRESTSFDPREPQVPQQRVSPFDNGKENQNAVIQSQNIEDNTIQCNEVSSSNIEVDNMCGEEEENEINNTKGTKRVLRSLKKFKEAGKVESKERRFVKTPKRKLELGEVLQPRKSLRIDSNQKKAVEIVEKERKALELETNIRQNESNKKVLKNRQKIELIKARKPEKVAKTRKRIALKVTAKRNSKCQRHIKLSDIRKPRNTRRKNEENQGKGKSDKPRKLTVTRSKRGRSSNVQESNSKVLSSSSRKSSPTKKMPKKESIKIKTLRNRLGNVKSKRKRDQ